MLTRKLTIFLLVLEGLLLISILLFYVYRGEIHVDEAGYVYAARQIAGGLLPYHDFLFLQTPVFPYVCAIPFLFGSMTFIMARCYMALFGIATIILTMVLANRMGGKNAALLAGFLFIVTPFQLQFFSIARNFSLTTFWLCAGLVFLTSKPGSTMTRCMAMIFFCVSMGTRLTLMPVPVLYLGYLFVENGLFSRRFFLPLLAGCSTLFVIIFPFYILDPGRFLYNIIGFHLDISVGGFYSRMILKAIGLSRLAEYYFMVILAAVSGVCLLLLWSEHPVRKRGWNDSARQLAFMGAIVAVIGFGHFSARFFQVSYQAVIFPVLVLISSVLLAPLETLWSTAAQRRLVSLTLLASALIVLLARGDSGTVYESGSRDIRQARTIARYFEQQTRPGDIIYSSDSTLIPFMANRTIMKHCVAPEYYPFWSDERVEYLGIFNHRLLKKLFSEQIPDVLLMSSKSFHVIMPYRTMTPVELREDLWNMVRRNYDELARFPNVLTPGDETIIYKRRQTPAAGSPYIIEGKAQ